MSSYSPYCTIMTLVEYLEYLIIIRNEYNKYKRKIHLFFSKCLGGDSNPIIKDLDKLLKNPPEKYGPSDWKILRWTSEKVKENG